MQHIWPAMADIFGSLPAAEQDELISLIALAAAAERGGGWTAVPDTIWTALTARAAPGGG